MTTFGAFEARKRLGNLLDRVEGGEEIVITRRGQPIARLVPHSAQGETDQIRAAMDRMQVRALGLVTPSKNAIPFDWEAINKLRNEGRP